MSPSGRRPGNVNTREEIVQAATRVFARDGYEKASLRGVAREAGVDAALVHHYFDGKADLFMAAMALPFDPRQVHDAAARDHNAPTPAEATIKGFLMMWDRAEGTGSSFASCVSAMAASTDVADAIREFVSERVWQLGDALEGEDDDATRRRRSLVSSQLMGLAFTRYLLRVPPVSTADPAEIARWVGPTLERYFSGPIDPVTPSTVKSR
jgi:AcrR family transcriptional regulator